MNIHGLFPLGWTGWISLQSKGLSRVFSNTTVRKYQFFSAQLSSWSNSHIHGLPCGSAGKESACNVGHLGSIPGLGRSPGEGKGYALQYSDLENSMDCINPWGRRESDTTERLSLSVPYMTIGKTIALTKWPFVGR